MSKKYMDFVPAKNADGKTAVVVGAPRRTNVSGTTREKGTRTVTAAKPRVVMPDITATPRTRIVRKDVSQKAAVRKAVTQSKPAQKQIATTRRAIATQGTTKSFAIRENGKLGEIEDLNPKFVNMDVPKRPLGDSSEHKAAVRSVAKNEIKEVKSRRLIGRFRNKPGTKDETKDDVKVAMNAASKRARENAFVAPKPTFINQDKVAKRPLSKNVYQKNIVATKEQNNKAPVAIIAKPEKESKAGLVVAIILTIILGAVAGTIAFLLLPK